MKHTTPISVRFMAVALLATSLMAGCASQSDIRILEDRIIALERRNMELQQQTEQVEQEKQHMRSQLENYNQNLEFKEQELRSQSAGLSADFEQIRNEIQAIKGRMEEMGYRDRQERLNLEHSLIRLERLEKKLDLPPVERPAGMPYISPPSEPEQPAEQPGEAASAPSDQESASPPAPAAVEPATENDLYLAAKQAFDAGRFTESRRLFHKLLETYPDSVHADNAQFWIGETHYREHDYEQAILEYQMVIEKYPKGNKIRASLLKQGFSFANMGDTENARLILQELIDKHPNSSEAKIAVKKLETL